ncbi:MAG: hypothetical protein KY469_07285 [Actinobacteria bacterium]|nr:hypothetical protein [Actinomycetota bacterium]
MLRARSLLVLTAATALAVAAEATCPDVSGPVLVTGRDRWGNTTTRRPEPCDAR